MQTEQSIQNEVKPETKNVQAETKQTDVIKPETSEIGPNIKSEENQANWKVFRAQRESERKAREDADRRASEKQAEAEALRAALEAITNKPNYNRQPDNSYEEQEESEEQRIDKRVQQALQKERDKYEKERQQREIQEYPIRLTSTYNDFNQVCSSENLDYLEYHYPEVASPFKHLPDGYDKWAGIYKAVKRFVPNPDSKKDMNRADSNLKKPGSPSLSGAQTPPSQSQANMLTEERKAANWARMQKTKNGLS